MSGAIQSHALRSLMASTSPFTFMSVNVFVVFVNCFMWDENKNKLELELELDIIRGVIWCSAAFVTWVSTARSLTAQWQKWKRVFLTSPCHKILEGRSSWSKKFQLYLKNDGFFANMWNLGQFHEKLIFCQ